MIAAKALLASNRKLESSSFVLPASILKTWLLNRKPSQGALEKSRSESET